MNTRSLLVDDSANAESLSGTVQAALAIAVVAVVAIAGIMSGLTLGLLTLDRLDLELMMRTGTKQQHKFAVRLMPMVNNPHWVLATLVICNTAASMALPLCLDRLVNVAVALVLSTTAIVVFGEILPQAVCSRYGLSIGGHTAPVVRLLMWLTAPISWPIGKALDALLGKENFTFGKRQIRALVDLHRESTGLGGPLNEEEFHVIQGVLDLGRKKGYKAMTPLEKVFMLSTDDVIDRPTLQRILATGHSRIPVYQGSNRQHILGLILVKELLAVVGLAQPSSGPVPVKSLKMRDLPALPVDTPMTDLLNLFQTGHSHMALLLDQPGTKGSTEYRKSSSVKHGRTSSSAGGGAASSSSSSNYSSSSSGDDDSSSDTSSSSCSSSESGDSQSPRSPRTPSSLKSGAISSFLQCLSTKKKHKSKKFAVHSDTVAAADGAVQHNQQPGAAAAAAAGGQVVIEMSPAVVAPAPADGGTPVATAVAVAEATVAEPSSPFWNIPATGSHAAADSVSAAVTVAAVGATVAAAAAATKKDVAVPQPLADAAVATDASNGAAPVGIITLEDVLEELMQEEIVDETDAFIDNEKTCRVNARVLAMSLPPGMRRLIMASQLSQQQLRQQQIQQQQGLAASPSAHNSAGAAPTAGPSEGQQGVTGSSSSNVVVVGRGI